MSNETHHPFWALLSTVLVLLGLFIAPHAHAVPAFARQMNAECSTCHFQHFAKLNAFGRAFKASGYSMTTRETLEGDGLSIAPNLNATFFLRSQYIDVDGPNGARGTWAVPNEAAILVGGRLAEGFGGLIEWGGPLLGAKTSFTGEFGGVRLGGTLFTTDALGAGYGFELMNTGAVRNQRPSERSSKPTLGSNPNLELAQAATGIALHASSAQWYAALTLYAPDSNEAALTEMDAGASLSRYLRVAWLPTVGGWDTGVGLGIFGGQTRATTQDDGSGSDAFGNTPGLYDIVAKAWFVDAQLQGNLAGRELGVYFIYASGDEPSDDADDVHLYAGVDNKSKGWGLDAEYFVIPKLAVLLSVGRHDNGAENESAKTSTGLGLYWKIRQNITLQPMYERYAGDQRENDSQTTVTLEAAF
jgi:hypothetical protein